MQTFYVALLAFPIGFFGSLLGVGGGTFLVPLLVLGLDMDPIVAMPISLTCTLFTGISGVFGSSTDINIIKRSLILLPAALMGVAMFVPLAHLMTAKHILIAFSMFIFLIAIVANKEIGNADSVGEFRQGQRNNLFGMMSALISGGCSGLFGVGGGMILIPLLRIFSRMPMREAMQISLIMMISTSTFGLLIHAYLNEISWHSGIFAAAATIPSGVLGGLMRPKISEKLLKGLFVFFAFTVAVATLIKALSL